MANPFFKFKMFTVFHDRCAMKVGTDGVLIGAWADTAGRCRVLDVGAGSGLVSLMVAQRNTDARIDALEIEAEACGQARENAGASPFGERITVYEGALQDFYRKKGAGSYDLIVSNPPFFTSSLKPPATGRSMARHSDTLTAPELIGISAQLLTEKGLLAVIYPAEQLDELLKAGHGHGLHPRRICLVRAKPDAEPKRVLLEMCFGETACERSELVIEMARHVYSGEFRRLTDAFYL